MSLSISLIMPTLNSQAYVFDALNSVQKQDFSGSVEVLIADGGSQDDTLNIARQFPFVRILDGADTGIYHGFNRGLEAAQGQIIGFLNSDDALAIDALSVVQTHFQLHAEIDYLCGGVSFGAELTPAGNEAASVLHNLSPLSIPGALFGIPAINARFFRTHAMGKIGKFSQIAGLAADREILLRLHLAQLKGANLQNILYLYRIHEQSATIAGNKSGRQRVWNAEMKLAAFLMEKYAENDAVRTTAHKAGLLARLKLVRATIGSVEGGGESNVELSRPSAKELLSLPSAIYHWRKHRGKLSGY